jgi:hypothetical protein
MRGRLIYLIYIRKDILFIQVFDHITHMHPCGPCQSMCVVSLVFFGSSTIDCMQDSHLILTYYVQALSIGTLTMLVSDSQNAFVFFVFVMFMFCPSKTSQLTRLDFFLKCCFFYCVFLWCFCDFAFLFCKGKYFLSNK